MANNKTTFLFNGEWYEVLKDYPEEVRLEVYEAAIRYALSGTLSELKPLANMAFAFIRKEIDYNNDRYNEIVNKRVEAGRKGGKVYTTTPTRQSKQVLVEDMFDVTKQAKQANAPLNDNDNVNDNVLNELSSLRSESWSSETDDALSEPMDGEQVDLEEFAEFYNQSMADAKALIPQVKTLTTSKRKHYVLARAREFGKKALTEVVLKAARSDYLNGKNTKGWIANFDWLMKPDNFPKVLEGSYDNKTTVNDGNTPNNPTSVGTEAGRRLLYTRDDERDLAAERRRAEADELVQRCLAGGA